MTETKPTKRVAWTNRYFDVPRLVLNARGVLEYLLPICKELAWRRRHPYLLYEPAKEENRDQLGFHKSGARNRLVRGGNQSGKSRCAAQEIAWILNREHPYQDTPSSPRIYVLSAEYRTLQEGIWRHLRELLYPWSLIKKGPNVAGFDLPKWVRYRCSDGTEGQVDFISGQGNEGARQKVQAAEVDYVFIDEEIGQSTYEELLARQLSRGGKMILSATLLRSEPWVLELEDRAIAGDPEVWMTTLQTEAAVEAGHLDRGAFEEMMAMLSPEEKAIRLMGQSRRSHGLVYPEFCERHTVDPFRIPKEWNRYMAIDPGFRTCAILWAAVAPDGKIYLYRERYLHMEHYSTVVDVIRAAEGYSREEGTRIWYVNDGTEEMECRWIDPSAFGHHETGEPRIGHLLAEYDLSCAPARNDVEYGIEMVRRAFMDDMDGIPQLRVFKGLKNFFKEIRTYRRQRDVVDSMKNERADRPVKRGDHLMDTMRYLIAGRMEARKKMGSYMEAVHRGDTIETSVSKQPGVHDKFWEAYRQNKKSRGSNHVGIGSEY